jgi:hypothetical protein
MTDDNVVSVGAPIFKVATAWGVVAGSSTVSDMSFTVSEISDIASTVASTVAAIYTLCLFGEWLWKKWIRPYLERKQIMKRLRRRKTDYNHYDD